MSDDAAPDERGPVDGAATADQRGPGGEGAGRDVPFLFRAVEDRVALTGILGALSVVAGSALPWAVVPTALGTITESGLEANGKLTLVAGVLGFVLLVAALRVPGRDLPIGAALAGAAASGIALAYVMDVRASSARVLARLLEGRGTLDPSGVGTRFLARPGAGVWVALVGGAAIVLAALLLLRRDRDAAGT